MAVIKIELISDVICPWCYLGYRRLQKAINLYKKTYPNGSQDVSIITWKPYFINQDPPKESILIQDRMHSQMSPERSNGIQKHLKSLGMGEGILFKFGGYIGDTKPSQKLLHLAGSKSSGPDIQTRVAEELLGFQYEFERDISKIDVLVEVGVLAGLDGEEVTEYLQENRGKEAVEEEERKVRERGVKGVPHYIFNGRHHIDGAVDMSEFFELFVQLKEGQKRPKECYTDLD